MSIWLRSQRNVAISRLSLQWVNSDLHVLLKMPSPLNISERTSTYWLKTLGLTFGGYKKGMYQDGHEREDVLYRQNFLDRMSIYDQRMQKYEGDDLLTVVEPKLKSREKPLVLLTHDESCFSSYDGKRRMWIYQNHLPLRPKGEGRSIMVSEFLCECHDPLKLDAEQQLKNPQIPAETVVNRVKTMMDIGPIRTWQNSFAKKCCICSPYCILVAKL
jgi:hypothetical protein